MPIADHDDLGGFTKAADQQDQRQDGAFRNRIGRRNDRLDEHAQRTADRPMVTPRISAGMPPNRKPQNRRCIDAAKLHPERAAFGEAP